LAVAAAPTVVLLEVRCGSGDAAPGDGGIPGCDVQWQAPQSLSCFDNPFYYSGPVTKGTMSDPAACGIVDAGAVGWTSPVCATICGAYGPNCTLGANDVIWCTDVSLGVKPDALCGRRPHGLRRARAPRSVAEQLASAAHLEAASVIAFEILRDELEAHRAPLGLRRAAVRAAADERRHARMMRRLATKRGARASRPRCARAGARDLAAIALENVVEGCVRETYGAAVALWQSEHARDRDVRAAMQRIADDEARHADLGWRVADWLNGKLDSRDRAAMRRAGVRAVEELVASADEGASDELGVPGHEQARAMLQHLWRVLWRPAFLETC
jgi:rubrerythrin